MTPEERKRRATLAIRTRWHGDDDAVVQEIRRGMSLQTVRDLIDKHGFTVEDLVQFRAAEAPPFTTAQENVLRPILSRGGE
jgi:hypothetical protein